MSEIIVAREKLLALGDRRVTAIVKKYMFRLRHATSPGKRRVHPDPTPAQVRAMRRMKKLQPGMNDCDIGRACGVPNHGRSSEVFHGINNKPVYNRMGYPI